MAHRLLIRKHVDAVVSSVAAAGSCKRYRTLALRGLMTHAKDGFYHDRRFVDLTAVVEHYN
jgi:hypothetical protein